MSQAQLFATRKTAGKKPDLNDQLSEAGFPEPETEYRFHPVRKWRFDMAFCEWKVAVEVEGAAFGRMVETVDGKRVRVGGRHNSGVGLSKDLEKYNEAQIQGWIVIRVTTTQIRDAEAISPIERALQSRGWRREVVPTLRDK